MSGKKNRPSASIRRAFAASLAATLLVFAIQPSVGVEPAPIKIAVFDFELKDTSAGGGIIAQDAIDTENLKKSAEEVRNMLSASGRFSIVDTSPVASEVTSAGGILRCGGCDGALAKKLGADQSLVGVITRVSRAEYTVQMLVRDAETGAVVSDNYSGLRMGANYSWPRGVKSLLRRMLPAEPAK